MSKLYVVCENGWDYDDNYYFSIDGVTPSKAYRSFEKANAEASRLNLANFKNLFETKSLSEYLSDFGCDIDEDKAKENSIFQRLFECDPSHWWYNQSDTEYVIAPQDKDWKDLYDCFNVEWYSVAEVDEED